MDSLMGSSNPNTNPMNALSALQMLKAFQQGGFNGVMGSMGGGNMGGGTFGQMPILGSLFNNMSKNVPMSNGAISSIANGSLAGMGGAPASAGTTLGASGIASAPLAGLGGGTLAPAMGATGAAASAGAGAAAGGGILDFLLALL